MSPFCDNKMARGIKQVSSKEVLFIQEGRWTPSFWWIVATLNDLYWCFPSSAASARNDCSAIYFLLIATTIYKKRFLLWQTYRVLCLIWKIASAGSWIFLFWYIRDDAARHYDTTPAGLASFTHSHRRRSWTIYSWKHALSFGFYFLINFQSEILFATPSWIYIPYIIMAVMYV